jgi:hypothetical protein
MNQTIGWLNGEMRAQPAAWFTKAIDPDVTLMHQPAGLSGGVRRRLFAYRRSSDVLNPPSPRMSANPQQKRHAAFTGGPLVGG